jgi:deazaflavin-dependent oxidoreductase (nitroreductase family)
MGTDDLASSASLPYCYLTTTGRRTGRPHTIEIWFLLLDGRVYLLSGGGRSSDWTRNLMADPNVLVKLGDATRRGVARPVEGSPEDDAIRRLMAGKYQGWEEGGPLSNWARTALLVEIELQAEEGAKAG